MTRCSWAKGMEKYHDTEWGVPCSDDQKLFEFIILEGAQAGLSWKTILNKREGYREAFDGFDAEKIAHYDNNKLKKLMNNPKIIRNRKKLESAVNNARVFLKVQKEFGSFSRYMWGFVGGRPIVNNFRTMDEVPTVSDEAVSFSHDMKKKGFIFFGPVICYAYMQAVGMVNNHLIPCERHSTIQAGQ